MRTLGSHLPTKHHEGVEKVARKLTDGKEVVYLRVGLKPLAMQAKVRKLLVNLGFRASATSPRPDHLKNVRTSALQVPKTLLHVSGNANLQEASELAADDVRPVRQSNLSDKARGRQSTRIQRLIVNAISDDLRLGAVGKLRAASITLPVQFELVPEKRAAFAHVNSHAANVAGTDCGAIRGTTFPKNDVCSLSFPLDQYQVWAKPHAGVAELVDALVLGSGQSALQINSLRSPNHWIVGANVRAELNWFKPAPSPLLRGK